MDEEGIRGEEAAFEVWELAEDAQDAQAELARRRAFKARASRLDLIGSLLARPYTAGVNRAVRGVLAELR